MLRNIKSYRLEVLKPRIEQEDLRDSCCCRFADTGVGFGAGVCGVINLGGWGAGVLCGVAAGVPGGTCLGIRLRRGVSVPDPSS